MVEQRTVNAPVASSSLAKAEIFMKEEVESDKDKPENKPGLSDHFKSLLENVPEEYTSAISDGEFEKMLDS